MLLFFLCFTSKPCEVNRFKQTAPCCLPNNIRPSWSAHKTARIAQPSPGNAKTPKSTCATDTDAYAKTNLSESPSEATGAAARVGRSAGSAAAGGRPAPPYGPLPWPGSRFRSPSLCIYMYLSTAQVASDSGILGEEEEEEGEPPLCDIGVVTLRAALCL